MAGTVHGKNAGIYLGVTTAAPLAEHTEISVNFGADYAEDSAQGDTNKSYKPGLFDFEGSISGWYDIGDDTMLTAALAGTQMKMYFYPNRAWRYQYFYGDVFVTLDDLTAPISDIVGSNFSLRAAGTITKYFVATTG
jgi:hypothetical protein